MSIETILKIESEGLSNTIKDYTSENYILSYTKKLQESNYPEDKEVICILVNKLINWYEQNYKNILDSKYLSNKAEHTKSYELLKELKELLK
jgi:hypothetical protein